MDNEIQDGYYAVLVQDVLGEGYHIEWWDMGPTACKEVARVYGEEHPDAHILVVSLSVEQDNHDEEA